MFISQKSYNFTLKLRYKKNINNDTEKLKNYGTDDDDWKILLALES